MNDVLIAILSVIGILALYWVIIGQRKYNKMFRQAEDEKNPADKTE